MDIGAFKYINVNMMLTGNVRFHHATGVIYIFKLFYQHFIGEHVAAYRSFDEGKAMDKAMRLMRQDRFREAKPLLDRIAASMPGFEFAYIVRGSAWNGIADKEGYGLLKHAKEDWNHALGICGEKLGEPGTIEERANLHCTIAAINMNLFIASHKQGEPEKSWLAHLDRALEHVEAAIALDPGSKRAADQHAMLVHIGMKLMMHNARELFEMAFVPPTTSAAFSESPQGGITAGNLRKILKERLSN